MIIPSQNKNIECTVPDDCPDGICSCGCDRCRKCRAFFQGKEQEILAQNQNLIPDFFGELFHWKTGYLRESGCILPRAFRSKACLTSVCKHKLKSMEGIVNV